MRLCFASSNSGKIEEVNSFFANSKLTSSVDVYGVDSWDTNLSSQFDPQETGSTFQENAAIKAKEAYRLIKAPVFAEDTGLCVDFLNGAPGVYSARYEKNDQARMRKLLLELKSAKENQRTASFVTALCLMLSSQDSITFFGRVKGHIALSQRGEKGFGYDPLFIPDGFEQSFAELTTDEKQSISHRGQALGRMANFLQRNTLKKLTAKMS